MLVSLVCLVLFEVNMAHGGMVNGRQKDITVLLNTRYVGLIELYLVMVREFVGDANSR